MNEENFPDALLKALYENEEQIGTVTIRVGDQEKEKPTAANWIQDFLGSTGGTVTNIQIAQYLTSSPNTKDLSKNDQETAKRLFQTVQALLEMFAMLKNFPESFEKIPIEQWKIIPYLEEKETTKLPKTLATIVPPPAEESVAPVAPPPAPVVAPVSVPASIPESAPTPKPESTSVPAPVVQKVVSAPPQVTASTAKSILPLSTTTVSVASVGMTNFVDAIIEKSGVVLPDDAHERVKKTIETRVRNVRNDIDTRHRLGASPAEGGAGLGDEKVSKIMAQIGVAMTAVAEGRGEEYAPSPQNVIPSVSEESREPQERRNPSTTLPSVAPAVIAEKEAPPKMVIKEVDGVPTIVEKSEKKGNGKKIEETLVVSEPAAVKLAPDLTPPPPSPPPPLSEPVKVPEHLKGAQEIPVAVKAPPSASRHQSSPTKKPIADVKQAPRLVGLTDELRALTIKDLRRMSENPAQACQKIADKINALAKESLSKRAEAISAWKESPAYQLYLEIGQLNLSQDMDKLAQARKAADKEYLTSEEFDALLDMNEKLRF